MKRLLTIAFVIAAAGNSSAAENFDIYRRPPAGMVDGWNFSAGRLTGPKGHSLTLFGNATVANGTQFLELVDGVGDYASLPDANEFSFTDGAGQDNAFTYMVWLYQFSNTYNQPLWDKYPELQIYVNGASANPKGLGTFMTNAAETAWIGKYTNAAPAVNQWVHYAVVYSGSETYAGITLLQDGVVVSGTNYSSAGYTGVSNGTANPRVGGAGTVNRARYAGLRIYRKALLTSEIAQIVNAERAIMQTRGTP